MLVINRYPSERIIFRLDPDKVMSGNDESKLKLIEELLLHPIEIKYLRAHNQKDGYQISLGIDAPQCINIVREELRGVFKRVVKSTSSVLQQEGEEINGNL